MSHPSQDQSPKQINNVPHNHRQPPPPPLSTQLDHIVDFRYTIFGVLGLLPSVSKTFQAVRTFEGLGSRVCIHVPYVMQSLCKFLLADIALVLLLSSVQHTVPSQTALSSEGNVADVTHIIRPMTQETTSNLQEKENESIENRFIYFHFGRFRLSLYKNIQ